MIPRNSSGRRGGLALALGAALALILAGPVGAQTDTLPDSDAGTTADGEAPADLPSGPPAADGTETDPAELPSLDLGETVTVDDEGNIIWNVDTETSEADSVVVEPTPIPESGIAGTGELESGVPGQTGTDGSGGLEVDTTGSGNATVLVLAIIGGTLVLAVGAFFVMRTRMAHKAELAALGEPLDPLADERLAGEFEEPDVDPEPAYAGAAEAGAYEEGGAAYAQYTDPEYAAAGAGPDDAEPPRNKLDQLRMSMVDMADKGLADAGQDRMVAKKLEAAGSQMRPGEWLVMAAAGTIGGFFGVTFLFGWLLGIAGAALVAFAFWGMLSFKETKRQKAFAEALPETLQLLAGSLRGGLSMMQAIQTVADEADEPTAGEFHRIVTETRLGRDLALAFRDMAGRMDSKDFEWVVTAIEIHREVGGDLAAILDRVSDTIRARNRVRGQVKALSAEGKMSGLILFFLPPGMVLAIATLNRDYLNEMVDTAEGQIMLIVSGVLLLIGGAWLKRLSRFVY